MAFTELYCTISHPQVRVFTFSVGQHNYDVTPLQWMACANKGKCMPLALRIMQYGVTYMQLVSLSSFLQDTILKSRPSERFG